MVRVLDHGKLTRPKVSQTKEAKTVKGGVVYYKDKKGKRRSQGTPQLKLSQ